MDPNLPELPDEAKKTVVTATNPHSSVHEEEPIQKPAVEQLSTIEFAAKAKLQRQKPWKIISNRHIDYELISQLSHEHSRIASRISTELKKRLRFPDGVEVSVSLEFSKGSIELMGVLSLLALVGSNIPTIVSTLADGFSLLEHLKDVISNIFREEIENKTSIPIKSLTVTKAKEHIKENRATRFLWWCAGAILSILQNCPTDKVKYQSIGGSVLTTGVLAIISGSYAFYTVFEGNPFSSALGALFGLLWGLIIFNIDRAIVASVKKHSSHEPDLPRYITLKDTWLPAIPRFLLAVILGFVIATPLELRLLKGPIDVKMADAEIDARDKRKDKNKASSEFMKIETDIERLNGKAGANGAIEQKGEIQQKEKDVNDQRIELKKEVDGTGGSRRRGKDVVAREKEIQLGKSEAELVTKQNELINLQNKRETLLNNGVDEIKKEQRRDFFAKMLALSKLESEESAAFWIKWFITLLFIVVELVPILIKLLSSVGDYEVAFNMYELTKKKGNITTYKVKDARFDVKVNSEQKADQFLYEQLDIVRKTRAQQKLTDIERAINAGVDWTYSDIESETRRVYSNKEFS